MGGSSNLDWVAWCAQGGCTNEGVLTQRLAPMQDPPFCFRNVACMEAVDFSTGHFLLQRLGTSKVPEDFHQLCSVFPAVMLGDRLAAAILWKAAAKVRAAGSQEIRTVIKMNLFDEFPL